MLEKIKINNPLFYIFLFFSFAGAFFFTNNALAVSHFLQVEQNVSNCNNDGTCDAWEIYNSCPNDCPAPIEEEPVIEPQQTQSAVIIIDSTIPEISDIKIEPSLNSVKISWETPEIAVSQVYWGKTQDYEEGSLSEISFLKKHAIKIENLLASSEYFFKIIIFNTAGNKKEIKGLSFKTLAPPDTEAPANVKNLRAEILGNLILLTWENPLEDDFEAVRITKRENFYPRDSLEGKVIYEGSGTKAEDGEIKKGARYYYSVFSRDKSQNYSSGAIISVIAEEEQEEKPVSEIKKKKVIKKEAIIKEEIIKEDDNPKEKITEKEKVVEKKEEIIKEDDNPKEKITEEKKAVEEKIIKPLKDISLLDFNFIQDEKKISFTGNKIRIAADKNLKISIDEKRVPKNAETLLIKLKDSEYPYETFSFILKRDKDKGIFAVVISPIGREGSYPLSIHFMDRRNKEFKKIEAEIVSTAGEPKEVKRFFENFITKFFWAIILFLITLFFIIIALWRERKREE